MTRMGAGRAGLVEVQGTGYRVHGAGCRVQGTAHLADGRRGRPGYRVQGAWYLADGRRGRPGYRVQGAWYLADGRRGRPAGRCTTVPRTWRQRRAGSRPCCTWPRECRRGTRPVPRTVEDSISASKACLGRWYMCRTGYRIHALCERCTLRSRV